MGRIQGDLKERTLASGERILHIVGQLREGPPAWVIAKQLGRSGTSIGANIWEANYAHSDADFAHKISIARKESSETEYWITLAQRAGLLDASEARPALDEAEELTRVLGTIVVKTQEHISRQQAESRRKT